ncbi:hypothetical protein BDZ91DRAFT_750998 [Kalaharituber pfeilii]|nr:hypothetical protein BDZ91DRAFT_750998 [Kalaharituber pfeilii]
MTPNNLELTNPLPSDIHLQQQMHQQKKYFRWAETLHPGRGRFALNAYSPRRFYKLVLHAQRIMKPLIVLYCARWN